MNEQEFKHEMTKICRSRGMKVEYYKYSSPMQDRSPFFLVLEKDQKMKFVYVTDSFPVQSDIPDYISGNDLDSDKGWFSTSGAMLRFMDERFEGDVPTREVVALIREDLL